MGGKKQIKMNSILYEGINSDLKGMDDTGYREAVMDVCEKVRKVKHPEPLVFVLLDSMTVYDVPLVEVESVGINLYLKGFKIERSFPKFFTFIRNELK